MKSFLQRHQKRGGRGRRFWFSKKKGIRLLETHLNDSEDFLAKQKLELIKHSNEQRTSSEELIKYAHKISTSNAVAAPATWAPG
ncbi:hypothetical protein LSAT2_011252 [Lamellibrachia satsuma]|nr:hypothetical protein LSAT2_011252 [Lamellibrachia satsuma]